MNSSKVFLSRPRRVYWAGWESNTYALQQAGWQFAVEEDFSDLRARIVMNHADYQMQAISHYAESNAFRAQEDPAYAHDLPPFRIGYMASNLNVVVVREPFDPFAFKPADMQPQIRSGGEMKSIDDFSLFAAPMARTNEIIVDPDSVSDMMQRILELQEPGRQEYFRKKAAEMRHDRSQPQPRQEFHAQILSLVA